MMGFSGHNMGKSCNERGQGTEEVHVQGMIPREGADSISKDPASPLQDEKTEIVRGCSRSCCSPFGLPRDCLVQEGSPGGSGRERHTHTQ